MSAVGEILETRFTRMATTESRTRSSERDPSTWSICRRRRSASISSGTIRPDARFLRRLASFSRLITFDRRGAGASDAAADGLAAWESWADDAGAVLDTVGSERAALLGQSDGGPTAVLFAATRPERTRALILFNSTARFLRDDDYPFGLDQGDADATQQFLIDAWGTTAMAGLTPQLSGDPEYVRYLTKSQRLTKRPRDAAAYFH